MKFNFLFIPVLFLLFTLKLHSQDVAWARVKPGYPNSSPNIRGMVHDTQGNPYEFGNEIINSQQLAFITKFNTEGGLIFKKNWNTPFFLTDVKIDPTNRIFFTGYFQNSISPDGNSAQSKGSYDVVVGEVNQSGQVVALKTFGGRSVDDAYGLALDNTQNTIVITGGVTDSVYMSGSLLHARQKQSMFIATFSKSLVLNNIQYFDFIPEINDGVEYDFNVGREVVLDASGNRYVLHRREGSNPLDENFTYPLSGIYLMKLNSAGAAVWTRRIIGNESYYGYGAHSLRVNQTNQLYLIESSSAKYGGVDSVLKFDSGSGAKTWGYSYEQEAKDNQEYYDLEIDNSNSLIVLGGEGMFICPCEDSRSGYKVIKKFSASNTLQWTAKFYNVSAHKLALDHHQNIYFTGATESYSANVGGHPLPAETPFIAKVVNSGQAPQIVTGNVTGSPFNPGQTITVPFSVTAAFNTGNVFTAQLSDAFGNFKYATNIGSVSSTSSGTITATIPSTSIPGTAYRIRVIASIPLRYGKDNGTNLTISGGSENVISANSSWKYLDNGSNQGTAWRSLSFNDASWKTGNAELGYGDGGEATIVSYGPNASAKYITTYFRKTVSISNPAQFTNFQLSLLRDDGAVVYVNGVEVARSNMPSGTIAYTTKASSAIDGTAESSYNDFTIPVSRFVNGTNIIAVEIHQSSAGSSDISFNLKLTGNRSSSATNELIPTYAQWRYQDNNNPGYCWQCEWYDDAAQGWKTGNAELGYGDGDEATVVGYGSDPNNKYMTTYFRKKFWADAAAIESLKLEIVRDDGAEVYLNGAKVFSSNFPVSNTIDGSAEKQWISATLGINELLDGENVLAVAIHQASKNSSDISFNLKLSPAKSTAPSEPPVTCAGTASILREDWFNVQGDNVADIPLNSPPSRTRQEYLFEESESNTMDNFGSRYRGYLCPPFTGAYTFWISSDDDSELWLSTNDNPTNKTKIAYVSGWTNSREWTKYPSQKSATITLNAGVKYYIEALHKEEAGGDNLAVGWTIPGGFDERPIPGNRMSPFVTEGSTELISANTSWKYLDNGTNQGTTWRSSAFSDAGWKTGNAELGYGDGGEATTVSYGSNSGNKYITTYFRKTFSVNDANAFSALELSLIRDDGAVVYLNGTEIYRNNLPSGTIYYNTLAPNYIDGSAETSWIVTQLSKAALQTGTNVLAVEIHQNSPSSSDISFNLKLKGLTGAARIDSTNSRLAMAEGSEIDPAKSDFILYPNPTSGKFSFEFCLDDVQEENLSVEIVNSVGSVVYRKAPHKINGCIREVIELEKSLPSGVYLMNVKTNKGTDTRKVLLTN